MILSTESGSRYEVNTETKQLRRLEGRLGPTTRIGKDGEWRSFKNIVPNPIQVGMNLIIEWGDDVKPMTEEGGVPITLTSPVVRIEE